MKTYAILLIALALFSGSVHAQEDTELSSELNQELDQLYSDLEGGGAKKKAKSQMKVALKPAAASNNEGGDPVVEEVAVESQDLAMPTPPRKKVAANNPPIVILNSPNTNSSAAANSQASQVQSQPTTYIEAQPLSDSKADLMRKKRQEVELDTEMRIVEKLELSRMEDEKRRAGVLFGDKWDSMNNPGAVSQAPVQAAPVAPAVDISGEVRKALADMEPKKDIGFQKKKYFGVSVGMGEYPDAVNMKGNYAMGVTLGTTISEHGAFEGSFNMSNFEVDKVVGSYAYYQEKTEVDQYSATGLIKMSPLSGTFKPAVGALASYTYRKYTDTQYLFASNEASSNAIDFGLMTGADVEIADDYSIGLDFRYMWNLTNKVDSDVNNSYSTSPYQSSTRGTAVEDLNYYILSVMGKMSF